MSVQVALAGLLVTFASGAASQQQPTLTVDDALEIALRRNPSYRQAIANRTAVNIGVLAGYGSFLPTATASIGWNGNRSTTVTGQDDFGQTRELPEAITFRRSASTQGINAQVTLFDGFGNVNNLRAARLDLEAADYGVEAQSITAVNFA